MILKRPVLYCLLSALLLAFGLSSAIAQNGALGTIQLTVTDASGAVIPEADVKLVKLDTNDTRTAKTTGHGDFAFANIQTGTYSLTVSHAGFATKIFDQIKVDASETNAVKAILTVGAASETVRVSADTGDVLETTSNQVGQVVDLKQVEDLPLQGRDLTAFSHLVAGYTGTFNGLPSVDSGNNVDGTQGTASRAKYGNSGATAAAASPRVETIEQESIQTDGLSLSSGFGQSTNQINYVTRRGSNKFHVRAYEDFRNDGLNAPSWTTSTNSAINQAKGGAPIRKSKFILNDFGVSGGGYLIRDRLFFFGSFATSHQPGTVTKSNSVFTPSAQTGIFTYAGTDGATHTVNVLQLAGNYSATLPTTINPFIATQLASINKSVASATDASLTAVTDPNLQTVTFNANGAVTKYFPAVRFDYNVSQKLRTYLSVITTTSRQPHGAYPAPFPGTVYANQDGGNYNKDFISTFGVDYTISPNLVNQFKLGFTYAHNEFAYNVAPNYNTAPVVNFQFPGDASGGNMSGLNYVLPSGNFYPLWSLSDNMVLQKGAHTIQYGFSGYREQDHYYNPPTGFANLPLGLATGDPALQAITQDTTAKSGNGTVPYATAAQVSEAQQLYAVLTGRVSSINGSYSYDNKAQQYIHGPGRYDLDELQKAFAFYGEDSWRVSPSFTLNYGLRWDFTLDDHDLTAAYHSARPDSVYGPTSPSNLFKPGSFGGNLNPGLSTLPHAYNSFLKTPQPAIGFAWNPNADSGFFSKLMGHNSTVLRGGFSLRNFTEPQQFAWDAMSDYGSVYYQFFGASANTTGKTGTFTPGSVSLGSNGPITTSSGAAFTNYVLVPGAISDYIPFAQNAFLANAPGVNGINPNIHEPYAEAWNFGIQRSLGGNRVLEIRYTGNHTVHQWLTLNTNEINIFENGFLAEFQRAQANLAAGGGKTFSDVGRGASNATPIMDAAFGGAGTSNFSNATFIGYLTNGQVGSFANQLAGNNNNNPLYFCNLVGVNAFTPCAANAGYTTAGAGYPINFFQANPYSGGRSSGYLTDAAYSNYNGLQVELRQGAWRGLQYNANYTYSKSLGTSNNNSYTASANQIYTIRNLALSYGPSLFDIQHTFHFSGTYDLPFGKGHAFLNHGSFMDRVVGGFNVGTIITWQTGTPFLLTGGFGTYNTSDGGVTLTGITAKDLQKAVGVNRVAGQTTANMINPKYIAANGAANTAYLAPNTTPGTIGQRIYLHGPNAFYDDIAVTKSIPIHERINFRIQGEFLNAFNHPVFGSTTGSTTSAVQSASFSRAGITNTINGFGRQIELRANIEF